MEVLFIVVCCIVVIFGKLQKAGRIEENRRRPKVNWMNGPTALPNETTQPGAIEWGPGTHLEGDMMKYYEVITLLAYLSLLLELTVFHVPSKVSVVSEVFDSAVPPLKAVTGKAVRLFFVAVSIATFLYPLTELIFGVGLHREPMALAGMAGVILMVSGRVLTTVAVFTIRARNSQEGEDFFLHTEGVYRYSRNPIQLGLYLLLVGMAAVYWNPLFVAGIVVYTVYMHVILLREERFLQQQFKEKYAEYVEQTGRYL